MEAGIATGAGEVAEAVEVLGATRTMETVIMESWQCVQKNIEQKFTVLRLILLNQNGGLHVEV